MKVNNVFEIEDEDNLFEKDQVELANLVVRFVKRYSLGTLLLTMCEIFEELGKTAVFTSIKMSTLGKCFNQLWCAEVEDRLHRASFTADYE